MPRSGVGIELLDDGRLLVGGVAVDGGLGAGAGHGRAQQDVDDEHHQKEDAEGHAEVHHPRRVARAVGADGVHVWKIKGGDYFLRLAKAGALSQNSL